MGKGSVLWEEGFKACWIVQDTVNGSKKVTKDKIRIAFFMLTPPYWFVELLIKVDVSFGHQLAKLAFALPRMLSSPSVYNENSPDATAIWVVFDLVRWVVFSLVR